MDGFSIGMVRAGRSREAETDEFREEEECQSEAYKMDRGRCRHHDSKAHQ